VHHNPPQFYSVCALV